MLKSDYLLNLNEKQQEAVEHLDGPLLIVAGAGSGKTKVLTSRIAHIIRSHKAFSSQILAVTFTNKAAKEMQIRVSKILGREATGLPWLGTFHSISAKILRKHADAVGLKSNFTIMDQEDQLRLIINKLEALILFNIVSLLHFKYLSTTSFLSLIGNGKIISKSSFSFSESPLKQSYFSSSISFNLFIPCFGVNRSLPPKFNVNL